LRASPVSPLKKGDFSQNITQLWPCVVVSCPEGAATNQPGATPQEQEIHSPPSPEGATEAEPTASFGIVEGVRSGLRFTRHARAVCRRALLDPNTLRHDIEVIRQELLAAERI
jgi:hypothetical protein